jgi:glycosyltransferase involved in cell wall biosynthesis
MYQFDVFRLSYLFNRKKVLDFIEKIILFRKYREQGGTHFVAISKNTYDYFYRVLPVDLRKIALLPNAINVKRFQKSAGYIMKRGADITLTTTGALVDKKNQQFLLDVVREIKMSGKSVLLHVLGYGPNMEALVNKAEQLGIKNEVVFHGSVGDVEAYLWRSDIYVHAALYEPFGLVLVEAMAAGLPVVCLDGGGNRDIIQDGTNGFILPTPDVKSFADKILMLSNDKNLYQQMQSAAIHTAMQYDITAYVHKLLRLYETEIKHQV